MPTEPLFDVHLDKKSLTFTFGTVEPPLETFKTLTIRFRTRHALFHLGAIALVAKHHKANSSFDAIPLADHEDEIMLLARASTLEGRREVEPYGALRAYFADGISLDLESLSFIADGKAVAYNRIPENLQRLLNGAVSAKGTASSKTVCLSLEKLRNLGIPPSAISKETGERLDQLLSRVTAMSGSKCQPTTLTKDQLTILTACKRLGIGSISENGIALDAPAHLRSAKAINILAFSAGAFIRRFEGELVSALSGGARLSCALAGPKSRILKDSNEMTGTPASGEPIKQSVTRLRAILRKGKKKAAEKQTQPGEVEIGYFATEFRCFLILCDDEWGWLTLHLPPKESVVSPSFELCKGPLLDDCRNYFDAVWCRRTGKQQL